MPFPVVTTFKTAGTYKKWQWPNSAHITYAWHALLLWHTYLHTYIYTAPARICTPLIVSRSLANYNMYLIKHLVENGCVFNRMWVGVYIWSLVNICDIMKCCKYMASLFGFGLQTLSCSSELIQGLNSSRD